VTPAAGPVAITGANSLTGVLLLERLRALGRPAWAFVRDATSLPGAARDAAARVVPSWTTDDAAVAALREADAIVHLAGSFQKARGAAALAAANTAPARRVAAAVGGGHGRARRIVYLSYLGADPRSHNAYLRTKGEAEAALAASGVPTVSFRCAAIVDGPQRPGPLEKALTVRPGAAAVQLGPGGQRLAPVLRDDVVAAIVAALDCGAPGVYDLAGPASLTADELLRLVNRDPGLRIRHLPRWLLGALAHSGLVPALHPDFLEVMLADGVGDPGPAVREFGLRLTPLTILWPR
jgi:NADH dehydrogenase